MADAAFKPERDYSKEADTQIPEAEKLAKVCEARSYDFCLGPCV
jgi:hypothetical protein